MTCPSPAVTAGRRGAVDKSIRITPRLVNGGALSQENMRSNRF